MKSIKLVSVFIFSIVLSTIYSCQNEPLDPNFQTENSTNNLDCLDATLAYTSAVTNFFNWDGEDGAFYTELCTAYASAIEDMINSCGDQNGSFQALLNTLGDCSAPLDPGTCESAIANSGIAENNLANAPVSAYTQFCNIYVIALEDQIEICGDSDGAIQAIIDSLGDCM